jgi:predicted Na+-dependent transporter
VRELLVTPKIKQTLARLHYPYVTGLNVLRNLVNIVRFRNGHSRAIRTLINVLVYILYSLNTCTNLDVNIRVELLKQVQVIRNYPTIVTGYYLARVARFRDRKLVPVVLALVFRVRILSDDRLFCKGLRKEF